jgi:hypothetical protein
VADYQAKLAAETQRVFSNGNATAEDRRWAEGYGEIPDRDRSPTTESPS